MQAHECPRIVAAETLSDGLVIKFEDGKCAFYATSLLYATFEKAVELNEDEVAW